MATISTRSSCPSRRTSVLAAIAAIALALVVSGCGGDDEEPTPTGGGGAAEEPEETEELTGAALGEQLFADEGCSTCHALSGAGAGHGSGPPLGGLFGSQVVLKDGTKVRADEDYVERAIAKPDAEIVRGYTEGDMSASIEPGSISGQDLEALVEYIKSLE